MAVYQLFASKIDFGQYGDLSKASSRCVSQLFAWAMRILKENSVLDGEKLAEDGIVMVRRSRKGQVIGLSSEVEARTRDSVSIRYGQLQHLNGIYGLGRKITLVPQFHFSDIIDFHQAQTCIEEGEFKKDKLDATFGRRIYMNGNY